MSMKKLYNVAIFLAEPLFRLLFAAKVMGREHIEALQGGFVMVANHNGYGDPPLLIVAARRGMYFMAKAELFQNKVLGAFFGWLQAFPVNRKTADSKAVRKAMQVVKQGDICGIFPEGRRSKTDEVLPFERGVAFITLQCAVPVVPVYIAKKRHCGRIYVNIGAPINVTELSKKTPKAERLQVITDYLRGCVVQLASEQKMQMKKK